ncbi:MAG: hypothetical protein ACFE94_18030 [Candidatus Hodarchaeota archaeon]
MILLTGFGPYGNYKENISSLIVQSLEIKDMDIEIRKEILPVSWKFSIKLYKDILNGLSKKPRIVILLGIHSNKYYHLERFSWNIALGLDIENQIKIGIIRYNARLWFKTKLNLKLLCSLVRNKMKIKLSNFAGWYLCNYIYYWALSLSDNKYPVLFIHIPHHENLSKGIETIRMIIKTIMTIL